MIVSQHIPEDRLAAYFDNEAAAPEALTIEQHVVTCAACRQVLDDMALTQSALRAAPVPALSHDVWQRVETALEPQRVTPILLLHPIPRIAVAACVALMLVALALVSFVDFGSDNESFSTLPTVSASAPFDLGWCCRARYETKSRVE